MQCDNNKNTNFQKFECATETCGNNCRMTDVMVDLKEEMKDKIVSEKFVSYYIFEKLKTFIATSREKKKSIVVLLEKIIKDYHYLKLCKS